MDVKHDQPFIPSHMIWGLLEHRDKIVKLATQDRVIDFLANIDPYEPLEEDILYSWIAYLQERNVPLVITEEDDGHYVLWKEDVVMAGRNRKTLTNGE